MSRNIGATQFLTRSGEPQKHCYLDQGTVLIFPWRQFGLSGKVKKKSSSKALLLLTTRDSLYSITSVALLLKWWSKTNTTLYLLRFTTSQPSGAKCKLQHIHLYSTSIPGSVIPPSQSPWMNSPPCLAMLNRPGDSKTGHPADASALPTVLNPPPLLQLFFPLSFFLSPFPSSPVSHQSRLPGTCCKLQSHWSDIVMEMREGVQAELHRFTAL